MKKLLFIAFCFSLLTSYNLHADEQTQDESDLRYRAYIFMTEGWGGEAIQGYQNTHDVHAFFHHIGKITDESVRLIRREDNPSVNDELYTYQYDGMRIMVYVAHIEHETKVMVIDALITNPRWPVKQGLTVGISRKQIEAAFGKNQVSDSIHEWSYGDGLDSVTYTFDKNDKAVSIHWRAMLD